MSNNSKAIWSVIKSATAYFITNRVGNKSASGDFIPSRAAIKSARISTSPQPSANLPCHAYPSAPPTASLPNDTSILALSFFFFLHDNSAFAPSKVCCPPPLYRPFSSFLKLFHPFCIIIGRKVVSLHRVLVRDTMFICSNSISN